MGSLLNHNFLGLRQNLLCLRQRQLQNTVLVRSGDGVFVDAGDIKAAAERAVPAFAADVLALVVFLILVLSVLRGDGQNAILDIQLNVLFVEARQLCLQHVLAVRVADVGAEVRQIYIAVAEEAAGAYLPFVTGATAGNVPVLGANGETLTDSGKSIGTSISDSDAIIPTAKAVKTYADGKIAKIAAPTAGDLVTVDSNGGLVDAHMTAGTATGSFAAAPSATNLPNEQAVAATIQSLVDALAWQTL